jgi:rubrerythrin
MRIISRTRSLSVIFALCAATAVALVDTSLAADAQPAAVPSVTASPALTTSSATLSNLMEAYNRQSNAREKYIAFAQKADQEKYHKAAELFRAAAKSEEIHLGLYAKNITKLGGTPTADILVPKVKNTRENLTDTVTEINDETGTVYPKHLAQSKAENVPEGNMAFGSSLKIRGNQKIIFEKALANLDAWKKASGGLYVCTVCGNLVEKLDFAKCAVCGSPVKEFVQIK